jgi:DinB family protein
MMQLRQINPLPGYQPEMGGWLWGLEEVRRRTLSRVQGVDQRTLDWEGPDGRENAIGSLLYHIAVSEMRWLFLGILGRDLPPSAAGFQRRDGQGRLPSVLGVPLQDHLACLRCSREFLAGGAPADVARRMAPPVRRSWWRKLRVHPGMGGLPPRGA